MRKLSKDEEEKDDESEDDEEKEDESDDESEDDEDDESEDEEDDEDDEDDEEKEDESEDEKDNLKKKYVELLKTQQESHDREHAHTTADDILCELLLDLGYKDVVEEYEKIDKWYA